MYPRKNNFMYPDRNHVGNIYFEFFKHPNSKKCFVICEWILTVLPSKRELMLALYHRGYSSIAPRYEGTWESKGRFLTHPLHQDVTKVIHHCQTTPIKGAYHWEEADFRNEEFILLGANLGGTVMLQIAEDQDFKTIALSPVIFAESHYTKCEEKNMLFLKRFLRDGFGNAYRFSDTDREKFARGDFFHLNHEKLKKKKKRILIITDKEDIFIKQPPIDEFCESTGIQNLPVEDYGPLSIRKIDKKILQIIETFI